MTSILFVGAHPDDVESGALGLLLELRNVKIHYIVMSKCLNIARNEHILEEWKTVTKRLGVASQIFDLPNTALDVHGNQVREILEGCRDREQVQTVICPSTGDIHQDHRAVAEEVARVFRHHTVLFYEVPHSCPFFKPVFFHPLNEAVVKQKLEIVSLYRSQSTQRYMSEEAILATLRFRGLQCGQKYAESFEVWRIVK